MASRAHGETTAPNLRCIGGTSYHPSRFIVVSPPAHRIRRHRDIIVG